MALASMERALERAVEARGPADVAVLPRPELREQIVGVSIVEEKALPEPGPGSPLGRTGLALWGIHLAAVFLVGGRGYGTGGGVRVSGDAQNRADYNTTTASSIGFLLWTLLVTRARIR